MWPFGFTPQIPRQVKVENSRHASFNATHIETHMDLVINDCEAAAESETISHQETDNINRLFQKHKIRQDST